jgi:uncharacterized protein (DUF1499 family)
MPSYKGRRMKNLIYIIPLLLVLVSCQGEAPKDIGVSIQKIGKMNRFALKACPPKPNCVSSIKELSSESNYIEPIKIHSNKEFAFEKIAKILLNDKSVKVITQTDDYIRAEFKSKVFKFVDDVEFFFGDHGVIQVRSASRLGHYDMNANKKRIEKIRFKFHQNSF